MPPVPCALPIFRILPLLFVLIWSGVASVPSLGAQESRDLEVTADFGFVNATGNSDVTTVNVGEEVEVGLGPWGVNQAFALVYGRTDGEVSASSWRARVRGDRTLGGGIGVYLLAAFDRNTFAGVSRRFEENLGLVFRVLDSDSDRLEFEAGAGLTQQKSTTGTSDSLASARLGSTYRRGLGESSHLQLSSELLPNLEDSGDLRVNSTAEVVAPLSQVLSTKLSYSIRFDRQPEPGFGRTDRIFTAGLQVTL